MQLNAPDTSTSGGHPQQPPVETVIIGTSVGSYHVLARLGAGGMGVVYEAEDLRLNRHVALKFLPESLARDPVSLSRFQREAQMASSLNHPHICTIYDIGTLGTFPYIVMELLEGETLRNRIATGPLSVDEFLQCAPQIVSAVAAAHGRHIVHRDLKPANIFVTRDGTIKILDFGLAKPMLDTDQEATEVSLPSSVDPLPEEEPELVTIPGTVLGTTAYMAPEQISGHRADARADVFALGVVFYEALAGRRPFAGVDLEEVRRQILSRAPPPLTTVNAAIPAAVDQLVLRCLEKLPERRFSSAVELQRELTPLVSRPTRRGATADGDEPLGGPHWRSQRIGAAAVLPFETRNSDPDAEYLGDAICEDLIRDLAQIPGLRVKARSVVQRYRGRPVTPAAIGGELGVDAVVLGVVSKRADHLSVAVEFVRCDDESLLWSGRLTGDANDLLAIEDKVRRPIAQEISSRLGGAESDEAARGHTPSPDAHLLYLRGRACWHERSPDSLRRAIEYFTLAVKTDPEYGLAFAGLADSYTALGFYDLFPPADVMPRARAAAERAVESDPDLPEGHASLGLVSSIWDFNWDEAGQRLRKALDINSSLAYVHHWYAMQLSTLGRGDEAYAEIKRALVLDPLSTAAQGDALNILIRARRFDDCAQEARRALMLEPRWSAGLAALGRALQYGGKQAEAIDVFEEAARTSPTSVRMRALLAGAYGLADRVDDAKRIRDGLTADAATKYVPVFWLAVIAHGLGETEDALNLLEQAYAERYPQVAYLAVEPAFDSLSSHLRFVNLLEQIGVRHVAVPGRTQPLAAI
jgi:serine/threonine protein kinase/tetratricopeptide (TPR) repeat protein